jgi:hypothetical protein
MPFQSKAQVGWMFANKPAMAKEWADKTPDMKRLPARADDAKRQIMDKLTKHGQH